MNYEGGYLVGSFVAATLFGTAMAVLISFITRRLMPLRTSAVVSVVVGFLIVGFAIIRDPETGGAQLTPVIPVAISAVCVLAVWLWRISLRDQENG